MDLSNWGYESNHPTNEREEVEEFTSTDLSECLLHYKCMSDSEPLENAIDFHREKIENATIKIQQLIDLARTVENSYMANELIAIRNLLSS